MSLRLLVVEDELLIAMQLEMLVWSLGHSVVGTATTADEALDVARAVEPDMALMDIRLAGGSSGIDAAAALYDQLGVRCVFLSANLDQTTRSTVTAFQPLGFVGKPFSVSTLRAALERAVDLLQPQGGSSLGGFSGHYLGMRA